MRKLLIASVFAFSLVSQVSFADEHATDPAVKYDNSRYVPHTFDRNDEQLKEDLPISVRALLGVVERELDFDLHDLNTDAVGGEQFKSKAEKFAAAIVKGGDAAKVYGEFVKIGYLKDEPQEAIDSMIADKLIASVGLTTNELHALRSDSPMGALIRKIRRGRGTGDETWEGFVDDLRVELRRARNPFLASAIDKLTKPDVHFFPPAMAESLSKMERAAEGTRLEDNLTGEARDLIRSTPASLQMIRDLRKTQVGSDAWNAAVLELATKLNIPNDPHNDLFRQISENGYIDKGTKWAVEHKFEQIKGDVIATELKGALAPTDQDGQKFVNDSRTALNYMAPNATESEWQPHVDALLARARDGVYPEDRQLLQAMLDRKMFPEKQAKYITDRIKGGTVTSGGPISGSGIGGVPTVPSGSPISSSGPATVNTTSSGSAGSGAIAEIHRTTATKLKQQGQEFLGKLDTITPPGTFRNGTPGKKVSQSLLRYYENMAAAGDDKQKQAIAYLTKEDDLYNGNGTFHRDLNKRYVKEKIRTLTGAVRAEAESVYAVLDGIDRGVRVVSPAEKQGLERRLADLTSNARSISQDTFISIHNEMVDIANGATKTDKEMAKLLDRVERTGLVSDVLNAPNFVDAATKRVFEDMQHQLKALAD